MSGPLNRGCNVVMAEGSTIGRSWPCLSSVDIRNVMALMQFDKGRLG